MKLAHPYYFDPITIEEADPATLVIENNRQFRNVIDNLIEQHETDFGDYVLSEENDILSLSKECLIISDPFNLNFESRQIKSKLLQSVMSDSTDNHYLDLISSINLLGAELCQQSRYSIIYNTNISLSDLLKWMDFKIDTYQLNRIEQILEYINVHVELLSKKLIIAVGLKDYLDDAEYYELIKILEYKHIRILFLEHRTHRFDDRNHTRIIDEDLCVI